MNRILKQIIPSWWLAASLAFPAAISAQSLTISQIQPVNSGLFRSNSQDFFEQGNRHLERETTILLQQNAASQSKILEIHKKLLSPQFCRPKNQVSSRHWDTVNPAKIGNLQAKIPEICRQK